MRVPVVAGVAILGLWAIWAARGDAQPNAKGGGPGPGPLATDAYRVAPVPVRTLARASGSLVPNEVVNIQSEVSRRLVKVLAQDGQIVKAGQLLFVLDHATLDAQSATLSVRKGLAKTTLDRLQSAFKTGATSQQELDQANMELQLLEAQQNELRVELAKTQIRAPFAGKLGIRRISEGAWVTPEKVLTTLVDLRRIKVDFSLPERHAPLVREGQSFEFRVAGREQTYVGQITAIEATVDAETRSIVCRGLAENRDGLQPGGFVTVSLEIARDEGFVVPGEAIVPRMGGHSVFVFESNKAVQRDVELGRRTDQAVQVIRGLKAGDLVLTSNLLRIRPGTSVELTKISDAVPAGWEAP